MKNERDYHFALGHFCAGCRLSIVLHKGCPMVVTKNILPETINKPKDKPKTSNKSEIDQIKTS